MTIINQNEKINGIKIIRRTVLTLYLLKRGVYTKKQQQRGLIDHLGVCIGRGKEFPLDVAVIYFDNELKLNYIQYNNCVYIFQCGPTWLTHSTPAQRPLYPLLKHTIYFEEETCKQWIV